MSAPVTEEDPLLSPAEVAAQFRCDPRSVTRWAKAGKIAYIRTPGGHRKYRQSEVDRLLAKGYVPASRKGDAA